MKYLDFDIMYDNHVEFGVHNSIVKLIVGYDNWLDKDLTLMIRLKN